VRYAFAIAEFVYEPTVKSSLKVDSNEKWGGSRRRSFRLGLWRSRVICILNISFLCKTPFPVATLN
jgi:hypothetical protein